jgi:hypothetical protein
MKLKFIIKNIKIWLYQLIKCTKIPKSGKNFNNQVGEVVYPQPIAALDGPNSSTKQSARIAFVTGLRRILSQ